MIATCTCTLFTLSWQMLKAEKAESWIIFDSRNVDMMNDNDYCDHPDLSLSMDKYVCISIKVGWSMEFSRINAVLRKKGCYTHFKPQTYMGIYM